MYMKTKIVKESLNELLTWEKILFSAPKEIIDLIEQSKTVPQGNVWHPEGEVYKHIRIVFDRARESGDINLLISALFHDLGKMSTTALNAKGAWAAHGHERVSRKLAKKHAVWIEEMGGDPEEVAEIVGQHMRIQQFPNMRASKKEQMKQNPFFNKIRQFTEFDNMKTLTDEELNRYK
jgi:hypothetical protein